MKIQLSPYNPYWKILFGNEKESLLRAMNYRGATIEHIGSTSVEGLAAKPVIDILIGLPDFGVAGTLVPAIVQLGYEYISRYEEIMPDRRFFIKEKAGVRTHHIHLVEYESAFWNRHIFFRDCLRQQPELRERYFLLKKKLAEQEWKDRNEYAEAKTAFIRQVEKSGGR